MEKLELLYAEDFALDSALRFLSGQDWSMSNTIQRLCDSDGLDPNLLELDRKSTRLNSSHSQQSRMPSSA